MTRLSRLLCRLLGHHWSTPDYRGIEVCTRAACRGHDDATRWTR